MKLRARIALWWLDRRTRKPITPKMNRAARRKAAQNLARDRDTRSAIARALGRNSG